jgi:hypothetical protein
VSRIQFESSQVNLTASKPGKLFLLAGSSMGISDPVPITSKKVRFPVFLGINV